MRKKINILGIDVYADDSGHIFRENGEEYKVNHSGRYDRIFLKSRYVAIHRIIATAFIPNPNRYDTVNHIDENKRNNAASNLEWCTQKHNLRAYVKNHIENPILVKKVFQCDLNGNVLCEYDGFVEAAKATGINRNAIRYCAIGRNKTSGGYIWKAIFE